MAGGGGTHASPNYQLVAQSSSGMSVKQAFERLGPIVSFEDLLCPQPQPSGPNQLAAEQVFHMIEGWRYASAATNAFLSHSRHTAIHFAYYAELRAALSLLSWSGIRIKQGMCYYLDPRGKKIFIRHARTHEAVWALWKDWVNRADAKHLFESQIRLIPSVPLSEVMRALQYINPTQTLHNWGFDLASIQADHKARNTSSYDAFWLNTPLTRMQGADLELVLSLWKLLLPDATGLGFDSALISYFVQSALPGMQSQYKTKDAMTEIVRSIARNTGQPEPTLLARLNPSLYASQPFILASASDTEAENVLCRAFFMLRLAMLATKSSLGGVRNSSTKTWISNWLEHAGLWDPRSLIDPEDVSVDYENAVEHLALIPSFDDLWKDGNVESAVRLTRPEACMIWNMI